MDNKIAVRFFRILPTHPTVIPFESALNGAFQLHTTPVGREKEIDDGVLVRLEHLAVDSSFVDGEIVRRQMINLPPEANDEGLVALPVSEGGGLGHCVAFRYHPGLQVIAIQADVRAVSIGKLLSYLRDVDASATYRAEPLVRRDAWDRYNRGEPRSFLIDIANPGSLANVEGEVFGAVEASKRLSEMFGASQIRIEVSMGRGRGHLSRSVVDGILSFFTNGAGANADVRKLGVKAKPSDGGATDAIDFISEILTDKDELQLPEGSPIESYAIRRAFVKQCFGRHLDYIRSVYRIAP